jgi:hypothetical protein
LATCSSSDMPTCQGGSRTIFVRAAKTYRLKYLHVSRMKFKWIHLSFEQYKLWSVGIVIYIEWIHD